MNDLPPEEEFIYWTEMLTELDAAVRKIGQVERNVSMASYINAMKLYDEQSFRIPLKDLGGALGIIRSCLLQQRNRVKDIQSSAPTTKRGEKT